MSTTTVTLGLTKPAATDLALIDDINTNMDTLDAWFIAQSPGAVTLGSAAASGSSSRVARADHTHDTTGLGYGTPVSVGAANASGAATTLARSDHVHKGATWLNHGPETFDLGVGITEDVMVYVPGNLTSATLVLRGRALVAGLLAAHTHTVTSNVTATGSSLSGGVETITSLGASATHTHSVTSNVTATTGNDSGTAHTHTGTSNGGSSHAHGGSTSDAEAAHTHSLTIAFESNHDHPLLVNDNSLSPPMKVTATAGTGYSKTGAITSAGGHSHTGSSSGAGSSHSHPLTIAADTTHTHSYTTGGPSAYHTHSVNVTNNAVTSGTESAAHTHSVTTSGHTHAVLVSVVNNAVTSGSTGSGGATASTRPAGVTVTIDGTDRTTLLGGAFGTSGSDWNNATLDILAYINSVGWHTITFGCSTSGRLKAQILMEI
jgi:hypothetical protein